MDPDSLPTKNVPRKVRFAPKAPPKRDQKPVVLPKVEKTETDIDNEKAEQLLRRLNETSSTGKFKAEKKVGPRQVAFGFGGSSSSIRSFGAPKSRIPQGSSSDGGVGQKAGKEYKEPWDYYTDYPVTLPLRRPYSGNPELLDQEEFGEDQENSGYDENAINSAETLGLLEENPENDMFFIQLPATLPAVAQSTNAEGPVADINAKGSAKAQKPGNLEQLPAGLIGKMLVYRSGAIKLKIGDILYDVSAGLDCVFAQDVVAIDTESKRCCNLGELQKRVVISPDIDSLLDSLDDSP